MKKLYLATRTVNVLFVSEDPEINNNLVWESRDYLVEESNNNTNGISFCEIKELSDIPKEWEDAPIYGIGDGDVTGEEFLASQDPEYQEFIRLKSKFEPGDVPEIVKYLDNK